MNTTQPANGVRKTAFWRKFLYALIISCLLYVVSYFADSFCGGYWLIVENDRHDRYSFGLAMPTAMLWQPRYGHESLGYSDLFGSLYTPLVRLDRKFIHPTIYISDKGGFEKASNLPVSQVHPDFRDGYVTKITTTISRDESAGSILCTMRLTGSSRARALKEIRMLRDMAQTLGASAPEGFIEKPWTETYMKSTNEKFIRWVGNIPLPKDTDVSVKIPAKQPMAGEGTIRFQCEADEKTIYGSKILFVKLNQQPNVQR